MILLVTGHLGYLGQVLTRLLKEQGIQYFGYDVQNGQDVLNANELREYLKEVDAVIHLAGIVGEKRCSQDIRRAYQVNAWGTLNLVDLARGFGIERVVLASTCSVYGRGGIYQASKLLAEEAARKYGYAVLRFGSLYGGFTASDSIVEEMVRQAKTGIITVYNPDDFRPLTHVEDAARATLYSLGRNKTFDGAGEHLKKGTLARLIAKKHGAKVKVLRDNGNSYKANGRNLSTVGFSYEWSVKKWLRKNSVVGASAQRV